MPLLYPCLNTNIINLHISLIYIEKSIRFLHKVCLLEKGKSKYYFKNLKHVHLDAADSNITKKHHKALTDIASQ